MRLAIARQGASCRRWICMLYPPVFGAKAVPLWDSDLGSATHALLNHSDSAQPLNWATQTHWVRATLENGRVTGGSECDSVPSQEHLVFVFFLSHSETDYYFLWSWNWNELLFIYLVNDVWRNIIIYVDLRCWALMSDI